MDTLCLVAFGIHSSTTSLRFLGCCILVAGIFATRELSCVEYFKFTKSDRTDVAFLDFQVESWNQVGSSR